MVYNNKKYLSFLKRVQLVAGVVLLLAITAAILLENFLMVAYLASGLVLLLVFMRLLNYNFVRLQLENGKLIIRYYPLYSVDRSYESVELPVVSLRYVAVKKYFLGLKWDLHLTVKLKQGLASYPPICLSAIPFPDRVKIVELMNSLIGSGKA